MAMLSAEAEYRFVVGKRGARVREGKDLKSAHVADVLKGSIVIVDATGEAEERVAILAPRSGFVSRKTLSAPVSDVTEEMVVRSSWLHHHPAATRSDEEWESDLDPEAFKCLRGHGTEPAGSGEYVDFCPSSGRFDCAACGLPLYAAEHKCAGHGWVGFDRCFFSGDVCHVGLEAGSMDSIECHCQHCHSHLGHLFSDGPTETRERQ